MPLACLRRLVVLAVVVAGSLLIAGCGGGDSGDTSTQAPAAASGKPLKPPKAKESLGEAQRRIEHLVSGDDCDQINTLNPVTRTALDTPERCEYLQRLAGLKVIGKQAVPGGGLIDYANGEGVLTAIIIVDSDGLYHVALYDPYNTKSTVGTPFAHQFDGVAQEAVDALREPDCDRYFAILHRFGRGAGADQDEVCDSLQSNPVKAVLATAPEAEPKRLGGNSRYAFYSLASPNLEITIVLARQSNEGLPEGVDPLPADAPEYAFIDAYDTRPPAQ